MIKEITVWPGQDKNGIPEAFEEITLQAGETISIVGPTGSGKTALITDIELLAQGTPPHNARSSSMGGPSRR